MANNLRTRLGKCYVLDEPGANAANGWVLTFDGPNRGYYWVIDRASSIVDPSILEKGADGVPPSFTDCYSLAYFVHDNPIPGSVNDGGAQSLGSHQEKTYDFGLKVGGDNIKQIVTRSDLVHIENNYPYPGIPDYNDKRLGNYVKEFNIPVYVPEGSYFTIKGDMRIDAAPDVYANTVGRIEYREYAL